MKMISLITAGILVTGCGTAYAQYSYGDSATQVAGHGHLKADNGMALYTFDKDAKGKSNCYGDCADSWPPYLVKADQAPGAGFTQIKRKDGAMQWAKDGAPLYFWIGDTEPGDTNGDGVGGVWHLAN